MVVNKIKNDNISHNCVSDDNYINKLTLGIRLIWVREGFRHIGIASRLIDTARRYFQYGSIIQLNKIAFSQPTNDGLAFALKYTKNNQIIGY